MITHQYADGGIRTIPDTARECHIVEAGRAAMAREIRREIRNAKRRRRPGPDPSDMRDIGCEEAHQAMTAAGASDSEIGDMMNAVLSDPRIEELMQQLVAAL